ncbi:MAG: hypothetical protein DLM54_06705 [Acidimicrobiales bacterium]|nr:MAG: hypothetical protein DLM54_06705 [Acidimicrobiales bacterium]
MAAGAGGGLAVVSNQGGLLGGLGQGLGSLLNGAVKTMTGAGGSTGGGGSAANNPPPAPHSPPSSAVVESPPRAVSQAPAGPNPYRAFSRGYDISWPQCGSPYPPQPFNMAIIGINDGRSFTGNPCLSSQARWAAQGAPSSYMNVNAPPPGPPNSHDQNGPAGKCSAANPACLAYNYGYNAAVYSVSYANASGVQGHRWWLDVELVSSDDTYWTSNQSVNASAIAGAIAGLQARGMNVGIYSTSYQFRLIAGGFSPRLPVWVGGAPSSNPGSECGPSFGFGGGPVWFTQFGAGAFDGDYSC